MMDRIINIFSDFDKMAPIIVVVVVNIFFLKVIPLIVSKIKDLPDKSKNILIKLQRSIYLNNLKSIKRKRHHQFLIMHQIWSSSIACSIFFILGICIFGSLYLTNRPVVYYELLCIIFAASVANYCFLSTFITTSRLIYSAHKLKTTKLKKSKKQIVRDRLRLNIKEFPSGAGVVYFYCTSKYYLYYSRNSKDNVKTVECDICNNIIMYDKSSVSLIDAQEICVVHHKKEHSESSDL